MSMPPALRLDRLDRGVDRGLVGHVELHRIGAGADLGGGLLAPRRD